MNIDFEIIKSPFEENFNHEHFTYDEIDKSFLINQSKGVMVHYLEQLQKDLDSRE